MLIKTPTISIEEVSIRKGSDLPKFQFKNFVHLSETAGHLIKIFAPVKSNSLLNSGKKAYLFLNRFPIAKNFELADPYKVTGYLSYYYLIANDVTLGVLFTAMDSRLSCIDNHLHVKGSPNPDDVEPDFTLEKLGLLMYTSSDGSTLIVPTTTNSTLLVKVD